LRLIISWILLLSSSMEEVGPADRRTMQIELERLMNHRPFKPKKKMPRKISLGIFFT